MSSDLTNFTTFVRKAEEDSYSAYTAIQKWKVRYSPDRTIYGHNISCIIKKLLDINNAFDYIIIAQYTSKSYVTMIH